MRFMVFTGKMVNGVSAIDREHSRLIDIINELYEIAFARDAGQSLAGVFDKLESYLDRHFQTEERLFAETGYPLLAEHRAEHAELKRTIANFRNACTSRNGTIIAADMLHSLKTWLNDHILNDDRAACRYLNEHGIH